MEESFTFLISSSGDIMEPYGEKDSIVKGRASMSNVLEEVNCGDPRSLFLIEGMYSAKRVGS